MISFNDMRHWIYAAADDLNLPITTTQANRLANHVALSAARGLTPKVRLSDRGYTVLAGLAWGEAVQDTAARLGLNVKTVKTHRCRMYQLLGAENGPHAVAIAMGLGLLRAAEQEAAGQPGGDA